MRTLRERLAAMPAPFPPGTLCRVVNERSAYHGMTCLVDSPDKYMPTVVCVKITSTGQLVSLRVTDLAPVERGE